MNFVRLSTIGEYFEKLIDSNFDIEVMNEVRDAIVLEGDSKVDCTDILIAFQHCYTKEAGEFLAQRFAYFIMGNNHSNNMYNINYKDTLSKTDKMCINEIYKRADVNDVRGFLGNKIKKISETDMIYVLKETEKDNDIDKLNGILARVENGTVEIIPTSKPRKTTAKIFKLVNVTVD